MPFFPKDSAIKVPTGSDLEKAISGAASVDEIHALLWEAAKSQRLIEKDPFDVDGKNHFAYKVIENPQPNGFAKSVIMNGVKIILEAASEQELLAKETDLYRQALAGSTNTPAGTEQARDTNGHFIAQPSQVELEAERLVNTDPTAAALAPSVKAYLESEGVSVDELREFTSARRTERAIGDWQSATTAFHEQHPDWCGGQQNTEIISRILVEQNLENAPDKLAALNTAVNYARKNNLLVENEEIALLNKVNAVTSYEDLKAQIGYKGYGASSGIWGR